MVYMCLRIKKKAKITAGNVQFKTTIAPEMAQKFITLVG